MVDHSDDRHRCRGSFALKNWQLADDLDRLISLETKTREEWLRDGVDVGRAGTMIGT